MNSCSLARASLLLFAGLVTWVTGIARANPVPRPEPLETVVLLHGLGMRSWAMWRLEANLTRAGYRVLNLSYPSRTVPLEKLGGEWLPARLRELGALDSGRLHFVTHSMGGIVVRVWLREQGVPPNLGRVVMVGPPNQGSAVVDRLRNFTPFRWYMGPNGPRLGTDRDSIPLSLGPWPAGEGSLGVIAGDRAVNVLFSGWLAGPNDGAVAVANAPLAGMSDFLVLHHSHTLLLWRADTLRAVRSFLDQGAFSSPPSQMPGAVGRTVLGEPRLGGDASPYLLRL